MVVDRFTELARRGGATPFEEWREFREAFRRRVGVEERDRFPLVAEGALRGLLRALPGRGVLGERSTAGLYVRGDLAGEPSERCFNDCARSLSLLLGFPGDLFEGDGEGEKDDAMSGVESSRWICLSAALCLR